MEGQTVQQISIVSAATPKPSQVMVKAALFNADGTPFAPFDTQAAASADAPALTSAVISGGESPTEAEYNLLRADLVATRSALNTALAALRTAGILAS